MKKSFSIGVVCYTLLFLGCISVGYADVKRSRSEGAGILVASNTETFGNLFAAMGMSVELTDEDFIIEPKVYGKIGLASLMYLSGSTGIPKSRTLGTTKLSVHLTTPGNDNLRLIGFGVSGDLLLSTTLDTSKEAPPIMPYVGFTGTVDIDLIRIIPVIPLKFYLNFSTIDDEKLMLFLDVIKFIGGVEYKGSRHSLFLGMSVGIYKEKINETSLENSIGYSNKIITLYPGFRYRIKESMSIVGSAKIMISKIGDSQYIPDRSYGGSFRFEIPLYFKDSNSESIRSLIFVNNRKKSIKEKSRKKGSGSSKSLPVTDKSTNVNTDNKLFEFDYFKRKDELKKRREKALEEIKQIEEMLE